MWSYMIEWIPAPHAFASRTVSTFSTWRLKWFRCQFCCCRCCACPRLWSKHKGFLCKGNKDVYSNTPNSLKLQGCIYSTRNTQHPDSISCESLGSIGYRVMVRSLYSADICLALPKITTHFVCAKFSVFTLENKKITTTYSPTCQSHRNWSPLLLDMKFCIHLLDNIF